MAPFLEDPAPFHSEGVDQMINYLWPGSEPSESGAHGRSAT